jgi:putative zinc finger protein
VSHLGDRAAALVDGQLSPDAADRATAHLATCRPCRDLVELERLIKHRLAALRGPAPSSDLVGRLLAMGGPAGPLPPRPGHVPGMPRPQTVPVHSTAGAGAGAGGGVGLAPRTAARPARRPAATRPGGRPAVLTPRRARLAAAVLGALSVVGVGVAGVTVGSASGGAVARPVPARLGTVSAPIGASVLTTTLSGRSSFDWLETPASGAAGGTQRILARR